MDRRTALKQMGGAVASLALLGALPATVTSCKKRMKRIVFYFTGTGNCLYIANQIGGDQILSIPQVMQGDQWEFEADEIGLVYPVYYASLPRNVEEFLSKAVFKTDYLFGLQTYSTSPGDATAYLQYHAGLSGKEFNYIKSIHMPSNFIPYFDVMSEENLSRANDTPIHLAEAQADIAGRRQWIEPLPEMNPDWRRKDLSKSPSILDQRSETLFTIHEDRCVGCGICTDVCPKGNYKVDAIARTSGECLYCLACANACPQKAITVNPVDVNPEHRYRHPKVSLGQIIAANQQR